MLLTRFEVQGYRSLRRLVLEPTSLVAIVGPNGSGKTNILRALRLLNAAARGTLARSLAEEGGIAAALWGARGTRGRRGWASLWSSTRSATPWSWWRRTWQAL